MLYYQVCNVELLLIFPYPFPPQSQYTRWVRKQGSSHVTTCLGCITPSKAMPVPILQKRGKARGSSIVKSASRVYKPSSCMANAVSFATAEFNLVTTGPTPVLLVLEVIFRMSVPQSPGSEVLLAFLYFAFCIAFGCLHPASRIVINISHS